jgi:O-antigen/teichoic acid export membrane protein
MTGNAAAAEMNTKAPATKASSPPGRLWDFFDRGSALVFPRIEGIILARWLGPSGFGTAQFFIYITSLIEIPCRAAPAGAAAYHAARGCQIPAARPGLKKWRYFCLAGLFAGAVFSFFWPGLKTDYRSSFLLLWLTGFAMLWEPAYSGWLMGHVALREGALARMSAWTGRILFLVLMLAVGAGYRSAQLAIIFSALVSTALSVRFLRARIKSTPAAPPVKAPAVDVVKFSVGRGIGLLAMLVMARNSLMWVQWMGVDKERAGLFAASLTLSSVIMYSWHLSSSWIMPGFVNCMKMRDNEEFRSHFRKAFVKLSAVTLPVFAGIAAFPGPILRLLFGRGYDAAAGTASTLAAGAFLFILYQFFVSTIFGRPWKTAMMHWACVALQAALCAVLIPRCGIEGAAMACLLSWGAAAAAAGTWAMINVAGDPARVASRGVAYAAG